MKVESLKRASALALGVTMAFGVFAAPVVVLADEATEEYATEAVAGTEEEEYDVVAGATAATEGVAEEATPVEEEATVVEEVTEEEEVVTEDEAATEEEEVVEEEVPVAPAFETVTRTETVTLRFAVGESSFTKNGAFHAMESAAFNRDGRVMLPLNAVGTALGAEVSVANDVATVVTGEATIALPLGVELPNGMGTPVVEYDVVFVPLGFIASSIGAAASWDAANNAAYITFNITIVEEVPVATPAPVAEPVVEEEPTEEDAVDEATEEVVEEASEEAVYEEEVAEEDSEEEISEEDDDAAYDYNGDEYEYGTEE